ncbi:RraA family protein [Caldifermentibacillus hisashii]|uniref:RraA family protein n=1 Tax=Bacillaceae TaxID=186817 RepID=UPI00203EFF03|nr:RraA family protein [Caldibacillus thermoamylovorans]MCM3799900.1 RraA family protein [Caldibacillus thermoamylovorans]MDL0418661.1 RraA family protein [Caldibacillus thermoamylovorans]
MEKWMKQFYDLPTTCISDALNGMNNLDPSIKPLQDSYKVAGRAFTVKIPAGDNTMVLKAIKEASPGDVLVVDAKGESYRAVAGDFVVSLAQKLGIAGIIVDGVIRDLIGVRSLNFPVFSKGTTVAASFKNDAGEINVPISCGGVSITPGDIIVGDADGVVVIPQADAEKVLEKALAKLKKDEQREASALQDEASARKYLEDLFS